MGIYKGIWAKELYDFELFSYRTRAEEAGDEDEDEEATIVTALVDIGRGYL